MDNVRRSREGLARTWTDQSDKRNGKKCDLWNFDSHGLTISATKLPFTHLFTRMPLTLWLCHADARQVFDLPKALNKFAGL